MASRATINVIRAVLREDPSVSADARDYFCRCLSGKLPTISTAELCALAGISRATLHRKRQSPDFPLKPLSNNRRNLRWPYDAAHAWAQGGQHDQ